MRLSIGVIPILCHISQMSSIPEFKLCNISMYIDLHSSTLEPTGRSRNRNNGKCPYGITLVPWTGGYNNVNC